MDIYSFKLLSTLPPEVRNSPVLQGLKILIQTVVKELQDAKERLRDTKEQLQKSQEQLSQANAKIESLEDELRRLR